MIFPLFLFSAFLGISRYFGFNDVLVGLVTQSPELYAGAAIALMSIRVGMAICKYYPMVANFFASVVNLSAKADDFYRRFPSGSQGPKDSPFKDGSKRSFSTRVRASELRNRPLGLREGAPHLIGDGLPGTRMVKITKQNPLPADNRKRAAKEFKHSFYHSTLLRLNFNLNNIHDYLSVKRGAGIMPILKGIAIFTGARYTVSVLRFLWSFAGTCHKLLKEQGAPGLVKYLKACGVSLQQSLGQHRVNDAQKLGARISRTKSGLPRIIPPIIRIRIRQGDVAAIRLTLTLINIFRVIEFPGTLKLETITAVSTATDVLNRYLKGMIPLFVKLFVFSRFSPGFLLRKVKEFSAKSVLPMFKGGPGAPGYLGLWNTHPVVMLRALLGLFAQPRLWEAFIAILHISRNTEVLRLVDALLPLRNMQGLLTLSKFGKLKYRLIQPLAFLGKLGVKEEAAGKVRVFAMVDAWTQWALSAFHEAIFLVLRGVPMDGTFNQTAPLSRVKSVRGLWSLDLSAATDRLPIWIQKELLGAIFGFEFAGHWLNLLVGRVYTIHVEGEKSPRRLKYSVGQPMGALSSWASLAITHHFLVQCSAWRAGFPKWKLFTNYAVLGDDVVIGDKRVATQYLLIMESLGVGVNTSKSLLSHTGTALEFAKRTIVNGQDVSPVAFKEFYAASRNIGAFVMLVKRTGISFASALQAMGAGWRVRSWLNKPIGKLSARLRLLILAINVPTTAAEANSFFAMGQAPVARHRVDTIMVILSFIEKEAGRLFAKIHSLAPLSLGGETHSQWALNKALQLAEEDLGLVPDRPLAWEGYSWHSEHTLVDLDWGTSSGAIRAIAVGLRDLILTIRASQTRNWKIDLNRLASEAWALMHLDPSIPGTQFADVYLRWLELSRELSAFSRTVEATSRPNPPEDRGILDPIQIRMWKRWSALLQGTKALEAQMDPKDRIESLLLEAAAQPQPEENPWIDWFEAYKFFCKAGFHEGYYNPWGPISNNGPVRGLKQYF